MPTPQRSIFRQQALEHFTHRREEDILPRLVTPRAFLLLWLVLSFIVIAGFFTWNISLPITIAEPGVVLLDHTTNQAQALFFISPDQLGQIHTGQSVQVQIGASPAILQQRIAQVVPQILSPEQIRQQYQLDASAGLLVQQPSAVAVIVLPGNIPLQQYAGSLVRVQIQTGTLRVISLIPFIGKFFGANDGK